MQKHRRNSYARRQAIANVRLEGAKITPEFLTVYDEHMDGLITLKEALQKLGIID